jgi:hypothetical protein
MAQAAIAPPAAAIEVPAGGLVSVGVVVPGLVTRMSP